MDKRQEKIYINLVDQIDSIKWNMKGISQQTRGTYYKSVDRFCKFLAENYGTQKFANVKSNHLVSYIEKLIGTDKSMSYIKKEISAIKKFHESSGSKKRLMTNEQINQKLAERGSDLISKRQVGGIDRAWTSYEVSKFKEVCEAYDNKRMSLMVDLAKVFGCRVTEMLRMEKLDIKNAIEGDSLRVVGKNGKERYIPKTHENQQKVLMEVKKYSDRQDTSKSKVFIGQNEHYKQVQKTVGNFISNHRAKVQSDDRLKNKDCRELQKAGYTPKSNLTMHGLRHTYAQNRMRELWVEKSNIKDYTERKNEVYKIISREMGHERGEVTRIYNAVILNSLY